MPTQSYYSHQILNDISSIKKEIKQASEHLHRINQSVINEPEIISYEKTHCNQCKEPCGRSNAEIFNCMMAKLNQNQTEGITQYTKENLELDLQDLIKELDKKQQNLQKIMENIQKRNQHS